MRIACSLLRTSACAVECTETVHGRSICGRSPYAVWCFGPDVHFCSEADMWMSRLRLARTGQTKSASWATAFRSRPSNRASMRLMLAVSVWICAGVTMPPPRPVTCVTPCARARSLMGCASVTASHIVRPRGWELYPPPTRCGISCCSAFVDTLRICSRC